MVFHAGSLASRNELPMEEESGGHACMMCNSKCSKYGPMWLFVYITCLVVLITIVHVLHMQHSLFPYLVIWGELYTTSFFTPLVRHIHVLPTLDMLPFWPNTCTSHT